MLWKHMFCINCSILELQNQSFLNNLIGINKEITFYYSIWRFENIESKKKQILFFSASFSEMIYLYPIAFTVILHFNFLPSTVAVIVAFPSALELIRRLLLPTFVIFATDGLSMLQFTLEEVPSTIR